MNRMPNEIIIAIFNQLHFKDKLQCALTCRVWYAKIISTVLYSRLRFKCPQSNTQTKANIKYMYDNGLGYQVLDLKVKEVNDPLELSVLCPNLRSLQVESCKCEVWNDNDNQTLAQNWEKLGFIKEIDTGYLLVTLKLLDTSFCMRSLASLHMDLLYQSEKSFQKLLEKLKHAPMLEHLHLEHVFHFNYQRIDLLHKNTPNLKFLELNEVNYLFVDDSKGLEEVNYPRIGNLSTTSKLCSFSITFESDQGFVLDNWEMNIVRCIEYISHKYISLMSVTIHRSGILESFNAKAVATNYLGKAFSSWIQLKKLDMRPIFLSADILHIMDTCHIRLEELKVYIHNAADMEQFINLAHSNQGKCISKLSVEDDTLCWPSQGNFIYFLRSLMGNDCKLKMIDMHVEYYSTEDHFDVLTPIQIIGYIPSLQKLSMRWDATREMAHVTYRQTTCLIDLNLELFQVDAGYQLEYNVLGHIQDLIYASPLLQSFSIICFSANVTLDFEKNHRLIYFNCIAQPGHTFQIVQKHRIKWYTFGKSDAHPNQITLKEEVQPTGDNSTMTLHLPPTIHSLFIYDVEYPL
jgi:hypothetical protein